MATDKKISDLTSNPTITGLEEIPLEKSDQNFKNTFDDLKTYVLADVPESGVQTVEGDGVDNTNPENPVLSFPNTSEVSETTDKNYVTDSEKTVIDNQSGTNTGDQDLSSLQPILSEGAFVDGDKTNLDNQSGTNAGDQNISAKIEATDYAVYNTGGTVKMSRNTTTSRTYIAFDGSDTPNVT